MDKKQSDHIHFNIVKWKLSAPPIAHVCVDPTRCTGDSMLTCCVSEAISTLLHFTPIKHKISQNTSIPSANGTGLHGHRLFAPASVFHAVQAILVVVCRYRQDFR